MSNIKDCGPAFPQDYEHTKAVILTHQAGEISAEQLLHCARQLRGMTLRDYFASKVLPAIYADCMAEIEKYGIHRQSEWLDNVAKDAYQIADAMLKARQE